jgi:capsular exopolysaccharide synthesis family protein
MELRDYLRILRKGWLFVVCLALAGVAGGAAMTILTTPRYQASTTLYVSVQTSDSSTTGDLVQGTSYAQQRVRSYVEMIGSARVLEPVINELDLGLSARGLAGRVSASNPLNTTIITISVTDESPQGAANIANAVGESLRDFVVDLETPLGGGPSPVKMTTSDPAVPSDNPSSPNTPLNLALGLLVGLALGVGAAVLRSVLDTRIHGPHDIEALTESPIIGGIAYDPDAKKRPLIVHADPRSPRAESFRTLRTNIQFVNAGAGPRTYVVTSSLPGEGKSTTTANLAIALAESGASVVLVDGDLRLPRVADYMAIEGAVGLTDVLIGRAELIDVLQPWGRHRLAVLPAGQVPPNPSELLGSEGMRRLLDELAGVYDYVLIDAPPLLPVTDAAVLSKLTGGVVVVSAAGRTRKAEFTAAVRSLDNIGSRVLGVILTMLPTKGPDSYGYGGAYGQYYGAKIDA